MVKAIEMESELCGGEIFHSITGAYNISKLNEKYEVDEMETIYRVEGKQLPDNKIEAKKKEIERQKKRTKIEAIVLTTLLMVLLAVLIYNSNRSR